MVNCGGEPWVQQQHFAMQKSGPVQNKLHTPCVVFSLELEMKFHPKSEGS